MRARLCLWVVLIGSVVSVDRHNFKTCNDSGFCKRLRGSEAKADSVFNVDPAGVTVGEDSTVVQVWSLSSSEVSRQVFKNDLNQVSPVS